MIRFASFIFAALVALLPVQAVAEGASANDTARLLAGLPPVSSPALEPFTKEASWQSHAKYFDKAWTQLDARQLSKVRAWSEKNLPSRRPVVFYTFSGPDFLYADAFFKGAETYILAGLEPVGEIPDVTQLPPKALGQELRELQSSLNSVLSYSFFITKRMKSDLRTGRLGGTLPVLYTFLARSGKTIDAVSLVALKPDGTLGEGGAKAEKGSSQGVKIEFTEGAGGKKQTLYYFSTDLSNGGIKTSGFVTFCRGFGMGDSFVKSASYLMHSDNFSSVREFLIEQSSVLVQDDSGIPLRFLDAAKWQFKPFGRYLVPLGIFPGTTQPKMRELFAKGKAQPLDFGVGYRWRPNETNLLLAIRQGTAAQAP